MARTISAADLDQRLAASLARIELSPEYRWRMVKRRRSKLDLSPVGMADKRIPVAIKELPPMMADRMNRMLLADFKPWMYPGLRPAVRKADEPGWLEWCIFPDARLVAEYAEAHRPDLAKATREVAEQIRKRAGFWIRDRLSTAKGLSTDDRARCKAFISDALRGQGSGRVTQGRDTAEQEREWVNAMLKVKSPWKGSPPGGAAGGVSTSRSDADPRAPGGQAVWPPRRYPEVERLITLLNKVRSVGGRLVGEWAKFVKYCEGPTPPLPSAIATWKGLPRNVTSREMLSRRRRRLLQRDRSHDDHRHMHRWLDSLALLVRLLRDAIDAARAEADSVWPRMDDRANVPQLRWWTTRLKRTLRQIGGLIPRDLESDLPAGLGKGVNPRLVKLLMSVQNAIENLKDISAVSETTSHPETPVQKGLVMTQVHAGDTTASEDASTRHLDAVRRFRTLYDEQPQLQQETHGSVEVVHEFLKREQIRAFSMDEDALASATQAERRALSLYLLAGVANVHPELGLAGIHRLPGSPTEAEDERDNRAAILWEVSPQWVLQSLSYLEWWTRVRALLATRPSESLAIVLSALQAVGFNLKGLLPLMEDRQRLRAVRRSFDKVRSEAQGRRANKMLRAGARLEEVIDPSEPTENQPARPNAEPRLARLLVTLKDGVELCGVAKQAVRSGGAARLDAVKSSGTSKLASELWKALDTFERAMRDLIHSLPDPRIVVNDEVKGVIGLLKFSQDAFNELRAAEAVSDPISEANPVRGGEKTKLAAREDATHKQAELMAGPSGADDARSMDHYRDAAWIRNATQDGLESDMLRKAIGRRTLRETKKVGKRWMFSVLELIRVYPRYGSQLRDALVEGADFRKFRKRESGKRSNRA